MNIAELYRKSKYKIDELTKSDLYTIALIILIGFAGFGLGRLSVVEDRKEQVKIEFPEYLSASVLNAEKIVDGEEVAPNIVQGLVVASKNGSKYHYPWCGGARSISENNKIYFDSIEDARKAGYTPANNCKGLK